MYMPLTINHKIDKHALLIPEIDVQLPTQKLMECMNSQELMLMTIWREVLGLSNDNSIKVTDNFYNLGGDSLGMLTVFSEITAKILASQDEDLFMSKMSELVKLPTIKNFSRIISLTRNNGF